MYAKLVYHTNRSVNGCDKYSDDLEANIILTSRELSIVILGSLV